MYLPLGFHTIHRKSHVRKSRMFNYLMHMVFCHNICEPFIMYNYKSHTRSIAEVDYAADGMSLTSLAWSIWYDLLKWLKWGSVVCGFSLLHTLMLAENGHAYNFVYSSQVQHGFVFKIYSA